MDIKTVKGRDYVQIVDDKGYLHHVGPANPENLSACVYIIGANESFKLYHKIQDYLESKGGADFKRVAGDIEVLYHDGFAGLTPRSTGCARAEKIEAIQREINDRADLFEMLEEDILKIYRNEGMNPSKSRLRRRVQKTYRSLSEERRLKLLDEFQNMRARGLRGG
jgi:hypothetical protein